MRISRKIQTPGPRPPQLPSNVPKYPLFRAIRALLKGPWGSWKITDPEMRFKLPSTGSEEGALPSNLRPRSSTRNPLNSVSPKISKLLFGFRASGLGFRVSEALSPKPQNPTFVETLPSRTGRGHQTASYEGSRKVSWR